MAFKIERKKRPWLKHDPQNPRRSHDANELRALGLNLQHCGQIYPLLVLEDGTVVDGNRRLAAGDLMQPPIAEYDCILVAERPSPAKVRLIQASVAHHHVALPAADEARLWQQILKDHNWTSTQLAEQLGISVGLVSQVLALLDNPPEIQELVNSGAVSRTAGYFLSRVEDAAERLRLARRLADGTLRSADLGRRVKKPKDRAPDRGPVKAVRLPAIDGLEFSCKGTNGGLSGDALFGLMIEVGKKGLKLLEKHDLKTVISMLPGEMKGGNT